MAFDVVRISVLVIGSGYSSCVGAICAPVVAVASITALKAFATFQVSSAQHCDVLTGLRLVALPDREPERLTVHLLRLRIDRLRHRVDLLGAADPRSR